MFKRTERTNTIVTMNAGNRIWLRFENRNEFLGFFRHVARRSSEFYAATGQNGRVIWLRPSDVQNIEES